jgi:hypothetical protein
MLKFWEEFHYSALFFLNNLKFSLWNTENGQSEVPQYGNIGIFLLIILHKQNYRGKKNQFQRDISKS